MINKIIKNKWLVPLVVALLISLPAVFRLFRPGFYFMYDDMQVIRLQEMDKCIRDVQIPCRWVPDLGYGYGYPLYEYYSPLPYYAMEVIHLSGFGLIDSVKIGFILSVFFSALFIYLLARKFFNDIGSLAVTVLYTLAPFRATGLYVRGAMAEAWGMSALPFLLLGFENLLEKRNKKSIVLFALTILVFLTTHNLTVFLSLPLILGWFAIRLYSSNNRKILKKFVISGVLGLMLSGFYIIPLIFERNLVHIETLTQGYFNYVSHFLSIKQLVASLHWGYGPSIVGPSDDQMLGVGPIQTIIALLAISILLVKRLRNKFSTLWIFLFLVFWGGLFLAHSRSSFIWKNLTFMKYFQFPWRWVFISTFAASFIGGLLFDFSKKVNKIILAFLIILLLVVYGRYFTPSQWQYITDKQKLSGELYERQVTASIYDYLPKSAKKAPTSASDDTLIVNGGDVLIQSDKHGSDWFEYQVDVDSDSVSVSIPAFDFPVWKILVDGNDIDYKPEGELGLPTFAISPGEHIISANLTKSTPRKVGDYMSLVGFVSVAALWTYDKKAKNK